MYRHNLRPMPVHIDAPPTNFLEALLALLRALAKLLEWLSF
jgi:hypothetical protein